MKFNINRHYVIIAIVLLVSVCLAAVAFPFGIMLGGSGLYYKLATEQQRVVSAMLAEDGNYADVHATLDSRGYAMLVGSVGSVEIREQLGHDLTDLYGESYTQENLSQIEITEQ